MKSKHFRTFGEIACEFFDLEIAENETVMIDKLAAITTERETSNVYQSCLEKINKFKK